MKIIKFLFAPFFFHKDVSYEFPGSVEDAVRRLSSSVKGNAFLISFASGLYGTVSATEVQLGWHKFFIAQGTYWLRPVFSGGFVSREGKTVLDGNYVLPLSSKIIVSIFLAAFPVILGTHLSDFNFLVAWGFAMFAFLVGAAGLNLGWVLSKDDIDDIDAGIRGAINRRDL